MNFYPVVGEWAAGSCSRWCSGPAPCRRKRWSDKSTFRPWMRKTFTIWSAGADCGVGWVSGSRRGKPAQCRCGQTNCSCHGAGVQRSGWSPWYPRYAGWKTVIAGCRKKSCSSKAKNGRKNS